MGYLTKKDLLRRYVKSQSVVFDEPSERRWAANRLQEIAKSYSSEVQYDIFLSHSYDDARLVKIVFEMLEDAGYKVYVDWIVDSELSRQTVTPRTAALLRNRMQSSRSLIYLTSQAATSSLWMPWELGYMDAKTGRVAVAPILEEHEGFEGREYLGVYPYLDLSNDVFYVQSSLEEWVRLNNWLSGQNPVRHVR